LPQKVARAHDKGRGEVRKFRKEQEQRVKLNVHITSQCEEGIVGASGLVAYYARDSREKRVSGALKGTRNKNGKSSLKGRHITEKTMLQGEVKAQGTHQ